MDPEDIELAYTGDQLAGDVLIQAITDGCPDVPLARGFARQCSLKTLAAQGCRQWHLT